ncbi:unnamed protein product [Gongylonema pulchrum]|uniref:4-nitrophenylphosphatase n=1 Tax=Gongylonema pulchrum TaxID=637853 RepID=A0A183DBG7_9BILA|nr:unnamed protein product [Gongylonema pulchrum]
MSKVEAVAGHQLLSSFQTFLFDADGVLWLGDTPLPGKSVFITTNNSTKTLEDYVKKCRELGFDMVPVDHILSPAKVLAYQLSREKSDLPVYLVGSAGLQVSYFFFQRYS